MVSRCHCFCVVRANSGNMNERRVSMTRLRVICREKFGWCGLLRRCRQHFVVEHELNQHSCAAHLQIVVQICRVLAVCTGCLIPSASRAQCAGDSHVLSYGSCTLPCGACFWGSYTQHCLGLSRVFITGTAKKKGCPRCENSQT